MPSRASIATGLYPHRHGARENGRFVLDPGVPTLGRLDEAERELRRNLALEPESARTLESLAYVALVGERYAEARELLGRFVDRAPSPRYDEARVRASELLRRLSDS